MKRSAARPSSPCLKNRSRDFANTISHQDMEWLSAGLEELLYGTEQTGFEMILDLLKARKLAKWSLMTVCPTYFHPQRDVFIKPTTVRGVIEYFELENLQYKPTPSWAFYEAYRSIFHEMKSKVDKSLSPTSPAFSGFLFMSDIGLLIATGKRIMNMRTYPRGVERTICWELPRVGASDYAPHFDLDWSIKDAAFVTWQQISIARMGEYRS
jgi:hypothetical protein